MNPRPLFDDDTKIVVGAIEFFDAVPASRVNVSALAFSEATISINPVPSIDVFVLDEAPAVVQAFKRGLELYPDIMRTRGHAVRNHFSALLPFTFEKLSDYGADILSHVAILVSDMVKTSESLHEIHATESVNKILNDADPTKQVHGFKALLGGGGHFNLAAATHQLLMIEKALHAKLKPIDGKIEELSDAQESLKIYVATLSILQDMPAHAEHGALLARKANLFTVSMQEANIAVSQAKALQTQARESIMRCEEVRVTVLPSYGLR